MSRSERRRLRQSARRVSLSPVRALFASLHAVVRSLLVRIDAVRIRAHLRRTETALRAADTVHLDSDERARRERLLDALRAYRRRGDFPTNEAVDERAPQFVGANGVPCAVAALLLADGRDDLVADVAAERNDLRIEAVERGPLVEWLDRNGLSRSEAARIQPAYVSTPPVGIELATDCGPLACRTARLLATAVAVSVFAALEVAGYRLVGGAFPDNPFKRRSALAYVTTLNCLLAPVVGVLCYALAP